MAETFICRGEHVHFTNGGCHQLYLTWTKCAEKLQYLDLAASLRDRTTLGWGCAADGIDAEYLSDEFGSAERKKQFLHVMDFLLDDIKSHGKIAKNMDVKWDEELRSGWADRLMKLRDALSVQINT
jgi:hypothetical protein